MTKKTKKKELTIDEMIDIMATEVAQNMDYAGLFECSRQQDIEFWGKHTDKEIRAAYKEHVKQYGGNDD